MRFRFLYLNEAGEEVEVGGLEELRACVAMGRVDENTLLFDAVTREWAPARAHSAYRLLAEEIGGMGAGLHRPPASASEGGGESHPPEAEDESPEEDILGALPDGGEPLPELTPVREPELPDTVTLFLEKEERERRLQGDEPTPSPGRRDDFHVVERSDDLARNLDEVAEPSLEEIRTEPAQAPPPVHESETGDVDDVPVPRIPTSRGPTPIRRRPVGARKGRLALMGLAALALVALWTFLDDDGAQAGDLPAAAESGAPPATPIPRGAMADAVAVAEGSAFEDMVQAMDSLRVEYGLQEGPQGWLDGHYLATASEYAQVEAYWRRYQDFVSELRSRDTALFRTGFVNRLREDGLEGPVVAMRLARALEDFRATQPARAVLYQGMDTLAVRALALHGLLLEREDEVEYDPVQLGTVSRDPVMEAFPSNPELRDLIWAHLDGIFEALDVVQGGMPGSRDQITDATLRAIRESPGNR